MGMGHLLHYIGADTAGPSACFPVIVYYRPANDIYKYLVICSAICVALLNCHYFGGNWAQPVINWILLSWGGSCLFINAAFTLEINHGQITINDDLVALSFCISRILYKRNTRNMETLFLHYFWWQCNKEWFKELDNVGLDTYALCSVCLRCITVGVCV